MQLAKFEAALAIGTGVEAVAHLERDAADLVVEDGTDQTSPVQSSLAAHGFEAAHCFRHESSVRASHEVGLVELRLALHASAGTALRPSGQRLCHSSSGG